MADLSEEDLRNTKAFQKQNLKRVGLYQVVKLELKLMKMVLELHNSHIKILIM